MFSHDWYHIVCVGKTHRKAADAIVFFFFSVQDIQMEAMHFYLSIKCFNTFQY